MILGIGVDAVNVERIVHWQNISGLVERYFHPIELIALRHKPLSQVSLSLAARFAAKEAFGKALGIGLAGIRLVEIQICNNDNGRPYIILEGRAKEKFKQIGGEKIHLTMTHEREYAISVVLLEGDFK